MYGKIHLTTVLSALVTLAPVSQSYPETLDQTAYDAVWDRLEQVLPADNSYEDVHVLKVLVPATWIESNAETALDLQNIAGAIPAPEFSIDPSRLQQQLHRVYSDFVLDITLPELNAKDKEQFEKASEKYEELRSKYYVKLSEYKKRWAEYKSELEELNEPVDVQARMKFRDSAGGDFVSIQNKLNNAMREMQKFAPAGSQFATSLERLRKIMAGAESDPIAGPTFIYQGGKQTLQAIKDDCQDDGNGWEQLSFTNNISSQKTRSSNWNANGGWSGAFFSFSGGGGGTNYKNVVKTSDDYVNLRFCNLTYVSLRPGNWWDAGLLKAIDQGKVQLKADSPLYGQRVFGPDGKIPRLVKGAIVARRVMFTAKLDRSSLEEIRNSSGGSGGLRIGPFSVGGGGGSTQYSREYSQTQGVYGRSTNMSVPVLLAIITETTDNIGQ